MKRQGPDVRRRGMSMLELVIASSMLAMILATVGVVMRTGRQAWEAFSADYTAVEAVHATVRHIVRQARQADSVLTITPTTDNSGRLSLLMPDGSMLVWDHDASTSSVNYGVGTPSDLLSPNIAGLRFTGYRADGVTVTTNVTLVRAIRVDATMQLPVEVGGNRTVSSWVWIRSW